MQPQPLAYFLGAKLIRFRQIWLDLGEILAKVIKIWAKLKSCIPKNIRFLTAMLSFMQVVGAVAAFSFKSMAVNMLEVSSLFADATPH